jgi:uncharacterized spore protein YtfJ
MPTEPQVTPEELMKRFGKMQESAGAKTVFGEPVTVEGRTIIPVARVQYMYGFGMGQGPARDEKPTGGGGGGGGVRVNPVGVLEITADGLTFKPVVDVTRLALAGMALAAWNVFWIALTVRAVRRRG